MTATFIPFPKLGPCPVAPETRVRPLFRGKAGEPDIPSSETFLAKQLRWNRFPGQNEPLPYDIVGYEVVN